MTTDLLLTQYQKSKLFNYNYYFSITFDSVKDKVVYYKILYGKSDDYFIDKKTSTNKIVITRYSILRLSNIQLDYFPPRTLCRHYDINFINKRLGQFKNWINKLQEEGKSKELFEYLNNLQINYD